MQELQGNDQPRELPQWCVAGAGSFESCKAEAPNMRGKVVSVFSNVAELGLFFAVGAAMCLGMMGLR